MANGTGGDDVVVPYNHINYVHGVIRVSHTNVHLHYNYNVLYIPGYAYTIHVYLFDIVGVLNKNGSRTHDILISKRKKKRKRKKEGRNFRQLTICALSRIIHVFHVVYE